MRKFNQYELPPLYIACLKRFTDNAIIVLALKLQYYYLTLWPPKKHLSDTSFSTFNTYFLFLWSEFQPSINKCYHLTYHLFMLQVMDKYSGKRRNILWLNDAITRKLEGQRTVNWIQLKKQFLFIKKGLIIEWAVFISLKSNTNCCSCLNSSYTALLSLWSPIIWKNNLIVRTVQ